MERDPKVRESLEAAQARHKAKQRRLDGLAWGIISAATTGIVALAIWLEVYATEHGQGWAIPSAIIVLGGIVGVCWAVLRVTDTGD